MISAIFSETFLSTEIFDPLTGQWGFGPDLRAEYGGSVEV